MLKLVEELEKDRYIRNIHNTYNEFKDKKFLGLTSEVLNDPVKLKSYIYSNIRAQKMDCSHYAGIICAIFDKLGINYECQGVLPIRSADKGKDFSTIENYYHVRVVTDEGTIYEENTPPCDDFYVVESDISFK